MKYLIILVILSLGIISCSDPYEKELKNRLKIVENSQAAINDLYFSLELAAAKASDELKEEIMSESTKSIENIEQVCVDDYEKYKCLKETLRVLNMAEENIKLVQQELEHSN